MSPVGPIGILYLRAWKLFLENNKFIQQVSCSGGGGGRVRFLFLDDSLFKGSVLHPESIMWRTHAVLEVLQLMEIADLAFR